jgi:hypothetical protein
LRGDQLSAVLSFKIWTAWRQGRTSIPAILLLLANEGYDDADEWLVEYLWHLEENDEEGRAQPWE